MPIIFNLSSEKGKIIQGVYNFHSHPNGLFEQIPVAIMEGMEDGPTISISANIHGDEYTGTLAIHELLRNQELLEGLKGRIIFLSSLNPVGATQGKRNYSFSDIDPNRSFPDEKSIQSEPQNLVEENMREIFQELRKHSKFHMDLHCSKIISNPFCYLRQCYSENEIDQMVYKTSKLAANSFGVPIVFNGSGEFDNTKNTFIGAMVFLAKIPGFTVELGSKNVVAVEHIRTGINGIKNVLVYLGLLDERFWSDFSLPEHLQAGNSQISLHPKMPLSGIIRFLVKPGDEIKEKQPIALLRDIHGRDIGDGFVYSDFAGHVLCQIEGAFFQKGSTLLKIAKKK